MITRILLITAIISEVIGTTCLKLSEGMTKFQPTLGFLVFYGISFYLLAQVLKSMEIGVVYALWSGIGVVLVAVIGIMIFGDTITMQKIIFMCLIVIGVVGLNLMGGIR